MSYWRVKRKVDKIINSLEDHLPVNPQPTTSADVTHHASNFDDSNTVESMDSEDHTNISEDNYESDNHSEDFS